MWHVLDCSLPAQCPQSPSRPCRLHLSVQPLTLSVGVSLLNLRLWPQLGRPLLRTKDQIVSGIVQSVADSFGSMSLQSPFWTVSLPESSCDVPSSRHHSWAWIPGRFCDKFQRSLVAALAYNFPSTLALSFTLHW